MNSYTKPLRPLVGKSPFISPTLSPPLSPSIRTTALCLPLLAPAQIDTVRRQAAELKAAQDAASDAKAQLESFKRQAADIVAAQSPLEGARGASGLLDSPAPGTSVGGGGPRDYGETRRVLFPNAAGSGGGASSSPGGASEDFKRDDDDEGDDDASLGGVGPAGDVASATYVLQQELSSCVYGPLPSPASYSSSLCPCWQRSEHLTFAGVSVRRYDTKKTGPRLERPTRLPPPPPPPPPKSRRSREPSWAVRALRRPWPRRSPATTQATARAWRR